MSDEAELVNLERSAWEALSTSCDAAASYFEDGLARRILMLLPGGMVIDDRETAIESMSGEPWSSFEMSDERVLRLDDDVAVVAYRVEARRGDFEYQASISSTYLRDGEGWKLAIHQQTPMENN